MSRYLAPFDEDGNLVRLPKDASVHSWRENAPFQGAMRIAHYPNFVRDRLWITLEDADGHTYPMLAVEIVRALYNGADFRNNTVTGIWDIRKAGPTYSLRYLRGAK